VVVPRSGGSLSTLGGRRGYRDREDSASKPKSKLLRGTIRANRQS
jgi:hypothetical protein